MSGCIAFDLRCPAAELIAFHALCTAPQLVRGLPRAGEGIPARPRLRRALDAAAPLTLVRGPSGTGKTALLRDWAATQPTPVAWVSAQRVAAAPDGHQDPSVRLAEALLAGLAEAAPEPAAAVFAQAAAAAAAGADLDVLLNRLGSVPGPQTEAATARALLACQRPQEALVALAKRGAGETPRQQAEAAALSVAARLQLDPVITPALRLELARLADLHTFLGLRLRGLYRKLVVSGRSEALQEARRTGML